MPDRSSPWRRSRCGARVTRRDALLSLSLLLCSRHGLHAGELSALDSDLKPSLDALASLQNSDGSFGSSTELFGRDPGVAGLCGLAFIATGSLPGRGRYGAELTRTLDFILSHTLSASGSSPPALAGYLASRGLTRAELDGLIINFDEKGQKSTYGHGYATLFLAESLGVSPRSELRARLTASTQLIERTQNTEGGWRYEPKRVEAADLSVTTCQLTALRAAKNAGIRVSSDVIERGLAFVRSLQNTDGGFRYMSTPGPSGYGRTASAICALQSGGADADAAIARGFEYMETIYPDANQQRVAIEYERYAMFYASLAYWRASSAPGASKRLGNFYDRLRRDTLAKRGSDGLWRSPTSTESDTAFAILSLALPREGIPFFLR